ncbi:SDR family oxidoreductase [Streptomyces sp. NBC_01320]|uniref:SDR family oxidoreductase n=1 Tax=Streptomyces sp. NBC_01320 TaxID=2903824 RepID=UPI002E13BD20|nr:SDR family oxidoreductase [Streptomyces sp. NBC_01320]
MRLEGKVAIVTGGASGIGAGICRRLSAEGASVAVLDRDLAGARAYAEGLARAIAVGVDISSVQEVDRAFQQVTLDLGPVDCVVNSAAIDDPAAKRLIGEQLSQGKPIDITRHLTDEQWRRLSSVNLEGTFNVVRAALREMLPRESGSIVTIASSAGVVGQPGLAHYSAAKAGVLGLTRAVAKEVAGRGVRVNAIAPGAIDTPMLSRAPASMVNAIPMGRLGRPDEIAGAALFLVSDDSSYITGETLNVNGGMVTV